MVDKRETAGYSLKNLEWDTQYFGVASARLELESEISRTDVDEITGLARQYEFITIRNRGNNSHNNILIGTHTNAFLTDCNVYYRRAADIERQIDSCISIKDELDYNDEIMQLAGISFSNSRFFKDPFISKKKAGRVYSEWINNAFSKKGRYFILYQETGMPVGFLLCSVSSESELSCELIAVNPKFKKRGIGRKLLDAFHALSLELKTQMIMIPTQADNLPATRLYSSDGFLPGEFHTIYHWWPAR